jgi:hypothetical protein
MKSILQSLNLKSLFKFVTGLFAVILLVANTGCNDAKMAGRIAEPEPNSAIPPTGKVTDLYKPIAPPEGGMNNYSDVDPRVDTSKSDAKADRLIDKADAQQNKNTNPFKQLKKEFDDKGLPERVGEFSKDLSKSTQEKADRFAKGTEKGFGNLKKNTESFKDDVKSTVDDLGRKVQDKTDDLKDTVRNAS